MSRTDLLYALVHFGTAISLVYYILTFTMQAVAYRRFRHASFMWLWLSTTAAIAYTALVGITNLLRPSPDVALLVHAIALGLLVIAMVMGLVATYSLFRAYGRLHDALERRNGTPSP